jgi:cardiolipin synthase
MKAATAQAPGPAQPGTPWAAGVAWAASTQPPIHEPASGAPARIVHSQALARSLGQPLLSGNRVDVLVDGVQTYAAMFEAIEQARDHINIESYIVEAEGPGEQLAQRLLARRRQGVSVNLLFDSFGSFGTSARYFEQLRRGGVTLCEYNPLRRMATLLGRALHLRDHRKLMVVDGRIGFIGGVNISGVYTSGSAGTGRGNGHAGRGAQAGWRDTHVRVEGPVVAELQRLFMRHWQRFACEPMQHGRYFPALHTVGEHRVGVAATDAGAGRNPFYRALLAAIDAAQQRVLLTSAYFVPTPRLVRALTAAAQRGVEVRMVLPGISDFWAPLQAGRSHYGRLLRAGVHIHELHDRLLHAKTTVVDGVWATIGSSNLDWRSFLHNAEANVIVLDAGFGAQVEQVFRADVEHCSEIGIDHWRRRGWLQRAQERLARRFEFFL